MVAKGSRDRRSSSSTSPSTKRRTSTATQEKKKPVKPMGICSFCMGDENKNSKGVPEDMIACGECGNCGHPSCLRYSDKLVEKIKTIRWQCLDCKRCIICSIGDDSLLFCDFCDAAIHPKCCDPPLQHIPKGDFACFNCREDGTMKSNRKKTSLTKTSSTRSLRSKNSSEDETTPTIITRPVAQLIDGMSNFFLPKKDKINNSQRQQSVQKAMKYLRTSKTKLLAQSPTRKNQLLARSVLAASKTSRLRRKPLILSDEIPSNSHSNETTPVVARRSINKTSHPSEESVKKKSSKRKHSTSPIPPTPIATKKRTKNDSSMKKTPSKRKESKTEEDEDIEKEDHDNKKSIVPKRKLNLDLSKYKTPPSFLHGSLPDTISSNDVYLFLDARKNSAKLIEDCSEKFIKSTEPIEQDANNPRWPPYIVFGTELIKTWYSSSYPQEYARVPRLFICEFCLKYMKCEQVYDRHRKKCTTFHPPANEIYHKDDLSVFEVDGNIDRIYCQNLCLLAKLFLDHKTLYYDVEPFLFYVLTKNDQNGCHFLGYFSKEKHCPQKYNLSCITVLPNCQRRGYGRFLIELSYLLSQKEGQIGTPERPLSTHGAQTYEAYWKIKLVEPLLRYYHSKKEICVLKDLMNETGMDVEDILDTLQHLGVLTMKTNEKPVIHVDVSQLEMIMRTEKIKHAHWVSLHSDCVRFTPVLKPILLITDGSAVDSQTKEIEVVFRKIEPETTESTGNGGESGDGTNGNNTTEVVRLIRRRKFGRKRRSYYVKYRVSNKTETTTTNHEDEQSQEYATRRRDSAAEKSTKDEDEEEEEEVEPEEEERPKTPPPPASPVKSPSKEPKYKQLTLDHFLKKLPSKPSVPEETPVEPVSEDKTDELRSPRRTKRLSNTHTSKSETDLVKMANGTSEETPIKSTLQKPNSFTRQVSETTLSSNDSPPASINSPLPFKKRAWTSSNVQALTDPSVNHPKKTEVPSLSRETSVTTPSSLADILANPLMSSSSSLASTDEETKIARIESQLKTSIEAVKEVDDIDDQPPSLTSPTSMIVSQSNHYNYSTRSTVAKQQQEQQQQQQALAMNNFPNVNNINYNYASTPYAYPYPPVPTMDMSSYYYPSPVPLNYLPYYPPSTAPMYPTGQTMCYPPTPNPYATNPNGSYNYPTPQSSSNRHM